MEESPKLLRLLKGVQMRRFLSFGFIAMMILSTLLGCEKLPEVEWELYEPGLMEEVNRGSEPVLAYFYAAWCPPCHELKKRTWHEPEVIERLAGYRRVKFDMSFKHSESIIALHREYRVNGLPHMILMIPGAPESEWMRINGFVPPKRFVQYLDLFESKSK